MSPSSRKTSSSLDPYKPWGPEFTDLESAMKALREISSPPEDQETPPEAAVEPGEENQ